MRENLAAQAIDQACGRIPPLWPLQNFVAVNPFLGLADLRFTDASQLLERVAHKGLLMEPAYYLGLLRDGVISDEDIRAAFADSSGAMPPASPRAWLEQELLLPSQTLRVLTVADQLDRAHGAAWSTFVTDEISKWCSSYFDEAQGSWSMPWRDHSLYQAWRLSAMADANPEVFGLRGFRSFVSHLPESRDEALSQLLTHLRKHVAIPAERTPDFLHRELVSVFGWSAWATYHDRRRGSANLVRDVLAIRLAYDAALASAFTVTGSCESPSANGVTPARHIAQIAAETAFRRTVAAKLATHAAQPSARASLQAAFCIDVRSEAYRRALEAQAPGIQTLGFAGFFGIALEFEGSARCPVLLSPAHKVAQRRAVDPLSGLAARATAVWKNLTTSASACFSSVETGGLLFAASLLKRLTGSAKPPAGNASVLISQIPTETGVDLVAGALKNMSLDPATLAPVVLLCGHGSRTENNPYAASLDCGACGGHKGDVNARIAAALMNDPAIREGLQQRGIRIPADTVFVAGLHITTTDEVILYDTERLPEATRIELVRLVSDASALALRERSGQSADEARRRSTDWSEVRPEWGLAGNAAFIAAPRSRTRDINLHGRAFLHDYDAAADPDSAVLTMILTAPVIVAGWINLQYYGSVVNNALFGSGNKVLHNVVGAFGVWEGNAGDLRTGLPLQSLHDGTKWVHEPLRLQVFIEAPRERIDAVLRANPDVLRLIENEWIHLIAIEGSTFFDWRGRAAWRDLSA